MVFLKLANTSKLMSHSTFKEKENTWIGSKGRRVLTIDEGIVKKNFQFFKEFYEFKYLICFKIFSKQ